MTEEERIEGLRHATDEIKPRNFESGRRNYSKSYQLQLCRSIQRQAIVDLGNTNSRMKDRNEEQWCETVCFPRRQTLYSEAADDLSRIFKK